MKIKIKSNVDKRVFELASDGKAGPDVITPDFASNIEDLAYLRAAGIETVDRGNDAVDIEFSVWKSFTNYVDCFIFCMDIRTACPKTGAVELIMTDGNGSKGSRTIANAAIPRIRARQMGTSANITFHIHGGVISKTSNPTS